MKNCFCTLFDHRYLDRGVALYESINSYCDSFQLWVLCMNNTCFDILENMNLSNIKLIKLEILENEDHALMEVKQQRTLIEYYFTCKPSLVLYVFRHCLNAQQVIYLDADTFFFASPEIIYDEIGEMSIAITPHRFESKNKQLEKFGYFNAGWLLFKRDESGLACLRWWRIRCIEWCYDYPEKDRFGDQKYLDQFSSLFKNVCIIDHIGANLAPWNIGGKYITQYNNRLFVNGKQVIFYHFHELSFITSRIIDLGYKKYTNSSNRKVNKYIYKPYYSVILSKRESLKLSYDDSLRGNKNKNKLGSHQNKNFVVSLFKKLKFQLNIIYQLLKGSYMYSKKIDI